jgi:hypothetical protein
VAILFMVINAYFNGGYWCELMAIILVAIGGYWWLLMVIGGYPINGY